jgi:hypothetical protein
MGQNTQLFGKSAIFDSQFGNQLRNQSTFFLLPLFH